MKQILICFIFIIFTASVFAVENPAPGALPTGAQVQQGNITIESSKNAMTIKQTTQSGEIHWTTFDIGTKAAVSFIQPSSSSEKLAQLATYLLLTQTVLSSAIV